MTSLEAESEVCLLLGAVNAAAPHLESDLDHNELREPHSINKAYEESLRRAAASRTQHSIIVNFNEQWTWDSHREAQREHQRKQREEERRCKLQQAYEAFVDARGLSAERQVIKRHVHDGAYTTDIRCDDVMLSIGQHKLLEKAELTLCSGHKYGFVGRNGSGKTTLLRALSDGEVEGVSPFIQIVHVEQEIVGSSDTPMEVVLAADVERGKLLAEEKELLKAGSEANDKRLGEVYERLDAISAHNAEARASSILCGLSFTKELMTLPTSSLSGGWRMRVALARALFVEPDVLLLDEPTNHLDLHAVLWLESFLSDWSKTLVVVSHSRSFLNNVCSEVIQLTNLRLHYFTGNYDQFETTSAEQLRQQQRQHDAQEQQRAHMQAFVDKFRYSAARAAMAQSRLKALERMQRIGPVVSEATFSFQFPDPEDDMQGPSVQIVDCFFGYKKGEDLLTDVNLSLDCTSRMALVGANGSGKSTFLSLCLGNLEPRQGHVIRNSRARIGYFAQHHLEQLSPQLTSLEFLRGRFAHSEIGFLRGHLSRFGLGGALAAQPIYTLSGGQKSRLALAQMTLLQPNLLLLDEPTNHLDIDTVNALLHALLDYKGGILVVSHDQHFITSLCDSLLVCQDKRVMPFEGDFEAYKASITKKF